MQIPPAVLRQIVAWGISAKTLTSPVFKGYKWMEAAQKEKKCPDWRRKKILTFAVLNV